MNLKKYDESSLRYEEGKASLHTALEKHDNTLILWALGNDGTCIDTNPFWQGMLSDGLILSHTIVVHGLCNGQREPESNFTNIYNEHTLGRPYQTAAWDAEESRYVQLCGTSFSAPLATIDAFTKAKEVLDQTGKIPSYADVKKALLMK
jgi:hypothetical protein